MSGAIPGERGQYRRNRVRVVVMTIIGDNAASIEHHIEEHLN